MKLSHTLAAALLAASAAVPAFASGTQSTNAYAPVTREHVKAELQAAQELGLVPITELNYPWSGEQSAQLQALTAQIEAG